MWQDSAGNSGRSFKMSLDSVVFVLNLSAKENKSENRGWQINQSVDCLRWILAFWQDADFKKWTNEQAWICVCSRWCWMLLWSEQQCFIFSLKLFLFSLVYLYSSTFKNTDNALLHICLINAHLIWVCFIFANTVKLLENKAISVLYVGHQLTCYLNIDPASGKLICYSHLYVTSLVQTISERFGQLYKVLRQGI